MVGEIYRFECGEGVRLGVRYSTSCRGSCMVKEALCNAEEWGLGGIF